MTKVSHITEDQSELRCRPGTKEGCANGQRDLQTECESRSLFNVRKATGKPVTQVVEPVASIGDKRLQGMASNFGRNFVEKT